MQGYEASETWRVWLAVGVVGTVLGVGVVALLPALKERRRKLASTPGVCIVKRGDTSSAKSARLPREPGEQGYYYAHKQKRADLPYQMNGPRLLERGKKSEEGKKATTQRITRYVWENAEGEVKITFKQEQQGWDWSEVAPDEIAVEWGPSSVTLTIDSSAYGRHVCDLPNLAGNIKGVRAKKLKTRLVLSLLKRATYPWGELTSSAARDTAAASFDDD